MDRDISQRPLLPEEFFDHKEILHDTYKVCFNEIAKQCTVLCNEHGNILMKIWDLYVESLKGAYDYEIAVAKRDAEESKVILPNDASLREEEISSIKNVEGSKQPAPGANAISRTESSRSISMKSLRALSGSNACRTRRSSLVKDKSTSNLQLMKQGNDNESVQRRNSMIGSMNNQIIIEEDPQLEPSMLISENLRNVDEDNVPESLQIRLRIVAEQAASVRRLRQSIFSSYVSNIAGDVKERDMHTQSKNDQKKILEEVVDVPEILQLSDAARQKKNLLELTEKRAREANEKIAKQKTKSLSERARIIEEEKLAKKAATLVQAAIRRRLARKRLGEIRSKALMRETRMDFNKYIRIRVKKEKST